jgi:Protein of unknown function (DUF2721)
MLSGLLADQLSQIISQSTAPAFLLGAVAGFLSVLVGRLNRIVDRGAVLLSNDDSGARRLQSDKELSLIVRRVKLTNRAIEFAVVSGICTTFLVIAAFVSALAGIHQAYGSALIFVCALIFFAASLICLWLEVKVAVSELDDKVLAR